MGEGQAGRTALRCPLPETRERRTEEPRGRKDGRKSRTYPFLHQICHDRGSTPSPMKQGP